MTDFHWILPALLAGALFGLGVLAIFAGDVWGYGAALSGAIGLWGSHEIYRGRW